MEMGIYIYYGIRYQILSFNALQYALVLFHSILVQVPFCFLSYFSEQSIKVVFQ